MVPHLALAALLLAGNAPPASPARAGSASNPGAVARYDVRSYGARADFDPSSGEGTDDTRSIQSAIDAAHAARGGEVVLPAGELLVRGTLRLPEGVTLRGAGTRTEWRSRTGTVVHHRPLAPGTDFLVASVSARSPVSYADVELVDFEVHGDRLGSGSPTRGNSRDGIYLQWCRLHARNVRVHWFGGKAWRFMSCINTELVRCAGFSSDYGVYFDSTAELRPRNGSTAVSTTVVFRACYFGGENRIAALVQDSLGTVFYDAIFESSTEAALIAEASVELYSPYFENNAGAFVRAGHGGAVPFVGVYGGHFQPSGLPPGHPGRFEDATADGFVLDRVVSAHIAIHDVRVPRATLIRTTRRTGSVVWEGPTHALLPATTRRTDGASVRRGDRLLVRSDDGEDRTFVVVRPGTLSRGQPAGYARTSLDVVDGSATLRSSGPTVFEDPSRVVQLADAGGAPGSLAAGALVLRDQGGEEWRIGGAEGAGGGFAFERDTSGGNRLTALHVVRDGRIGANGSAVAATHGFKANRGLEASPPRPDEAPIKVEVQGGPVLEVVRASPPQPPRGLVVSGYLPVSIDGEQAWIPLYRPR